MNDNQKTNITDIYDYWRSEALLSMSKTNHPAYLTPNNYVPLFNIPFTKSIRGDSFHDKTYIRKIIDQAIEYKHVYIQPHALYILDLSYLSTCPYKSLVFQINDVTLKTTESTSTIMERLAKTKRVGYNWSKLIANSLGYKHRIPYISGSKVFVPNCGVTEQNTSWLALHNIFHVEYDVKDKLCDLYTSDQMHISLPWNKSFFSKEIERCANIYHVNQCIIGDMLNQIDAILRPIPNSQQNIIQQMVSCGGFKKPDYSIFDYIDFLKYVEAQDIISHIVQEDNPYLEEFQSYQKIKKQPF